MQKKHYFLIFLLFTTAFLIGGCGNKKSNPPAAINNAVNDPVVNQDQEQKTSENQNPTNSQANDTVSPSGQYSINELFDMKRPMKCSWKDSVAEGDITNIIYLNDKNFYQDVTMGDVGHSFMIYNGDYLYIWNDFNDAASKMKEVKATTGAEPKKDSAGLDQKKDFICENWAADNSFFAPPANKNFKDVTKEMTEAVQELNNGGAEKINKQACDLCKKAPTQELRDECIGDMKCD